MSTSPITFIGGGNMARSLIAGLVRQGVAPASIHVAEPVTGLREQLTAEFGIRTYASASEAAPAAASTAAPTTRPRRWRVRTPERGDAEREEMDMDDLPEVARHRTRVRQGGETLPEPEVCRQVSRSMPGSADERPIIGHDLTPSRRVRRAHRVARRSVCARPLLRQADQRQ